MGKQVNTFQYKEEFKLELGGSLPGFQLEYTTHGTLNSDKGNVIWVCHALTGNSDFTDWWHKLFADGGLFDSEKYFVICANSLGGCYGSTGPLSDNPTTGKKYFHSFPHLTNRDVVAAFDLLRKSLSFEQVHTLIGGSLGGQQVLEWAILRPDVFQCIIPIGCNALHSPWGIAFNEAQRMAIEADSSWREDHPKAGSEGLKAARALGMISYREYATFQETQKEKDNETTDSFRAASYLQYQGNKLANRFNAFTYWILSKMMDSHNLGRGREDVKKALSKIRAKTLVIGISSDILFPVAEQKFISEHIPGARFEVIESLYGHDGFLVEFEQMENIITRFYREKLADAVI